MLAVWREVGRHIALRESAEAILPLLQPHLPLAAIVVRRLDLARSCMETIGVAGPLATGQPAASLRTDYRPAELEKVLGWCRQGSAGVLANGAVEPSARLTLPADLASSTALVLPLGASPEHVGVAVLIARAGATFDEAHRQIGAALREPFTVALENDLRVRELEAHRQAAEADRLALLNRLGRQQVTDTIVGVDLGLREVFERVDLVARSDVPVLILGETGSGKEVVARAIHNRSPRAGGPFLRVNCGAIPPELIDSELFGHERGSFTGASSQRKGWFERADGGTLFLDEVAELPLAAQVRLLRILQDGTFERVGGQATLTVDVRVIAATNQDVQRMVRQGAFREDLWYRLADIPIDLPALRERPEDLPALANHFANRAARRFGLPVLLPTREDLNLLLAYDWPGNVRELAAVIDRAAILGNGKRLEVAAALGATARLRPAGEGAAGRAGDSAPSGVAATNGAAGAAPGAPESSTSFPTLDEATRSHIEAALTRTHGRIEGPHGAARLLGINPHTLRARMRKLGIAWQSFRTG
jgi:transcriptional regulator with GAF, ATPase, and Fis domain